MKGVQALAAGRADRFRAADGQAMVGMGRGIRQLTPRALRDHARIVFQLFQLGEHLSSEPFELVGWEDRAAQQLAQDLHRP